MLKIKEIMNGKIINGKEDIEIAGYNISTNRHFRNEFYIPIFWREDRHKYIIDAVREGASGYMISSSYEKFEEIINESKKINPNITIYQVENVNETLLKMAENNRNKHIDIPIIAVTGSVGKTTTTYMINTIINQEKKSLSDSQNNNTKILLSLLLLHLDDYDIATLEVGIARKNTMEPISKLLQPSIVVINNIGTAHIGNIGSKEEILKEKLLLKKYIKDEKVVFLNGDDKLLSNVEDNKYKIIKFSTKEVSNVKYEEEKITFEMNVYNENTQFCLNSYCEHDISNAVCAIRVCEFLKISKDNIVKGIKEYKNVKRRFNVIKGEYTIIDDTYNASSVSMKSGLISASNMKNYKRKIAVLGDMLELGEYSEKLHTEVGNVFENLDFDLLFTQGENTRYICKQAEKFMDKKKVRYFDNQEGLIKELLSEVREGDLIYLKASKKMKFNKIVEKLLI